MSRSTKLILITCAYLIGVAFLFLAINCCLKIREIFTEASKHNDKIFRIDTLLFVLSFFLAFVFLAEIISISLGLFNIESLNWSIMAYAFFATFSSLLFFGLSIANKENLDLAVLDQMILIGLKYIIITALCFMVGACLYLNLNKSKK